MMRSSRVQTVREYTQRVGAIRPRDLRERGLPPEYLSRLHQQGEVERVGRGLYIPTAFAFSEHQMLIEASLRVPHGVICLLSALSFHELTTQNPFEIWMAIDGKAWLPKVSELPLRFLRFSGNALTEGVETHEIAGVPLRVYNPAKTVADCFKYRNKIGLDVAMEALQDSWRQRRVTIDAIRHYARIDRVLNIMSPYLDALTAW